jgi:hypothetical protein
MTSGRLSDSGGVPKCYFEFPFPTYSHSLTPAPALGAAARDRSSTHSRVTRRAWVSLMTEALTIGDVPEEPVEIRSEHVGEDFQLDGFGAEVNQANAGTRGLEI